MHEYDNAPKEKRIVLAVTGSIAVYKAVDLASKLTQAGALVDVVMTDAAREFVTPLTFQAVTDAPFIPIYGMRKAAACRPLSHMSGWAKARICWRLSLRRRTVSRSWQMAW